MNTLGANSARVNAKSQMQEERDKKRRELADNPRRGER